MDKIKIIILAFALILISCKKEEPTEPVNCYCGKVEWMSTSYSTTTGQPIRWVYNVKNLCTNRGQVVDTYEEIKKEVICLEFQW